MARADLPSLHIRLVRDDAVPPDYPDLVRLGVDHVFLEVAHQGALLGKVGLTEHFAVEIQLLLILEVPIICRINRTRQVRLDIDQRVWHTGPVGPQANPEIPPPRPAPQPATPDP